MPSSLLTAHARDADALGDALASHPYLVVALCAAWCGTCGEFRRDFAALAAATGDATFVWLDIEDDADTVGDIDVENFPTVAIYLDGRPLHFGVSLPQAPLVGRLLASLDARSPTATIADESVATLPARLAATAEAGGTSALQTAR